MIDAAIDLLHRSGYAATSLARVAQDAGVSLGAVTHHFPAKHDLMVAVTRQVLAREVAVYERGAGDGDPAEWLRNVPALVCEVLSQPAAIAQMEIMLATRSDEALASRLRDSEAEIVGTATEWLTARFRAAGVPPRPDDLATMRFVIATARGLALMGMSTPLPQLDRRVVELLAEAFVGFHPELAAAPTNLPGARSRQP